MKKLLLAVLLGGAFIAAGISLTGGKETEQPIRVGEYIKINIAELYLIIDNPAKRSMLGEKFIFQGQIYEDPEFRDAGFFSVLRIAMVCCAADMVGLGFRVPLEYQPADISHGSWVNIRGHLVCDEPAPSLPDQENQEDLSGMRNMPVSLSVRSDCRFIPDKITPIDQPDIAYIYFWNSEPPYYY